MILCDKASPTRATPNRCLLCGETTSSAPRSPSSATLPRARSATLPRTRSCPTNPPYDSEPTLKQRTATCRGFWSEFDDECSLLSNYTSCSDNDDCSYTNATGVCSGVGSWHDVDVAEYLQDKCEAAGECTFAAATSDAAASCSPTAGAEPNDACAAVELVSPCITFDGQQPEVTAECAGKHPI